MEMNTNILHFHPHFPLLLRNECTTRASNLLQFSAAIVCLLYFFSCHGEFRLLGRAGDYLTHSSINHYIHTITIQTKQEASAHFPPI